MTLGNFQPAPATIAAPRVVKPIPTRRHGEVDKVELGRHIQLTPPAEQTVAQNRRIQRIIGGRGVLKITPTSEKR